MPDFFQMCNGGGSREETGICRVSVVYLIPGPAAADGQEPYDTLFKWKPAAKPAGLEYLSRNFHKRPDGDWDLTLNYAGAPDDNTFGFVLELDYASVDSPLETLETWDEFADKYKATIEDDRLRSFARRIKDPTTGKQIKNPVWGQTHFLETNPVLRITFGRRKFAAGMFLNCSKIQEPAVPREFSEAAKSPDNRTWLKRTVKGRFYGNAWQFSVEYILGLWNPDICSTKKDDGLKTAVDASTEAARSGGGGTD